MDQTDKLNRYRGIIQQVIEGHAQMPAIPETVEGVAICDTNHDRYLLMDVGWMPEGRAHDVVVHLRLRNGKVIVEWDGIESGIARDLIDAGIDPQDIIYAEREHTTKDFAESVAA